MTINNSERRAKLMDIPELSMAMSQNKIMTSVGTAVLSNSLDMMEAQAAQMAGLIDAAPAPSLESLVNPSVGANIDMLV